MTPAQRNAIEKLDDRPRRLPIGLLCVCIVLACGLAVYGIVETLRHVDATEASIGRLRVVVEHDRSAAMADRSATLKSLTSSTTAIVGAFKHAEACHKRVDVLVEGVHSMAPQMDGRSRVPDDVARARR